MEPNFKSLFLTVTLGVGIIFSGFYAFFTSQPVVSSDTTIHWSEHTKKFSIQVINSEKSCQKVLRIAETGEEFTSSCD